MSVRLRLRREGTKKKPHYRIVAADRRSPRDGRFIEIIGTYDPQQEPSHIEVDAERALYWLRNGAQPTSQVENLLTISGVWEQFKPGAADEKRQRAEQRAQRAEQKAEQKAQQKAQDEAAQRAGGGDAPGEQTAEAPEDVEQPEVETADAVAETEATAAPEGGPGEGVEPGGSAPEETATEPTSEAATAEEDESA